MAKIAEISTLVTSDDRPMKRGLETARKAATKGANRIQGALNKISFKSVALGATAMAATIGLSIKKFTDLAAEQEAVERRLAAVLKSTGEAAGFNIEQLKAMAAAMQDVTTVGDEVILSGMAMLATFKQIRGEAFERASMAALDLAEVMQTDLRSSVIQIGKALNDPIANLGALGRAGIQFTKDQKELIKQLWQTGRVTEAQNIILTEMESQFGGTAKAAKDTFGGALKSLQNTLGDTGEKIGFALIPPLKDLIEDFDGWIDANQTFIDQDLPGVIRSAGNTLSWFAKELAATRDVALTFWDSVSPKRAVESSRAVVDHLVDAWKELRGETEQGIPIEIWGRVTEEFDLLSDAIGESDFQLKDLKRNLAEPLPDPDALKQLKELNQALEHLEQRDIERAGIWDAEFRHAEAAKGQYDDLTNEVSDYSATVEKEIGKVQEAWETSTYTMERTFSDFLTTGKIGFKSFVGSILSDLARFGSKELISGIGSMLFGKTGAIYEMAGGVQNIGGIGTIQAHHGAFIGEKVRGVGASGKSYEINPNEYVIPADKMGAGVKVEINIENQSGVELEAESQQIQQDPSRVIANMIIRRKTTNRNFRDALGI